MELIYGRTHGAPYRGYGYVPLRFGGNVVRRMGTQQHGINLYRGGGVGMKRVVHYRIYWPFKARRGCFLFLAVWVCLGGLRMISWAVLWFPVLRLHGAHSDYESKNSSNSFKTNMSVGKPIFSFNIC